jgi:hypothetical protein
MARLLLHAGILLGWFYILEDGGNILLRNIGALTDYKPAVSQKMATALITSNTTLSYLYQNQSAAGNGI